MSEQGYVHIYTGNGKGKTTAAVGLLVRCLGAGFSACLLQFLKPEASSEIRCLKECRRLTLQRFGTPGFVRRSTPAARAAALEGLQAFGLALRSKKYKLVVADEIVTAVGMGLLTQTQVLQCLALRPRAMEVVLTGRGAGRRLIAAADLVTQMRSLKHYYRQGVQARRGIEH